MTYYIDCYGSFSNVKIQEVLPQGNFKIENHNNILNIHHIENNEYLLLKRSGFFTINLNLDIDLSGIIGIYRNNNLIEGTVASTNQYGSILVNEIVELNQDDIITIKNLGENQIKTRTHNLPILTKNLELIIVKIGDNGNDYDSSSSDSESSN